MLQAELVLFAIQAALKLYAGVRQAYVDSTRDRPLVLPLPRATETAIELIGNWFETNSFGMSVRDRSPLVQNLLIDLHANEEELRRLYFLYLNEVRDDPSNDVPLSGDDLAALLTVRQWAKGEDVGHPSSLQRIAGTLIEIAVDYFAYMPGAVSQSRPEGRALLAFLRAIDDVDFVNAPNAGAVVGSIMVGVLNTVGTTPGLLVIGKKEQMLVAGMSTALARAATRHLGAGTTQADLLTGKEWLQLAAASLAKGASDTVLANPELYLPGDGNAGSKVLQDVLGQIADLAIGPEAINLQALVTTQGLTTISQAALASVSRNPEILGSNNEGLKKLVSQIAASLADATNLPKGKDLAPAVISLVLARSADNLDLFWGGDRSDAGRNLLVLAAGHTLAALSAAAAPGPKPPAFVQEQILSIVDAVLAEVEANPDWVLAQVGMGDERSPVVKAALAAALAAMKGRPLSKFGADTAHDVLLAALGAVALRIEFLDKLPDGQARLTAALDVVLSAALTETVPPLSFQRRWQLAQASAIDTMVKASLDTLASKGVTDANLAIFKQAMHDFANSKALPADLAKVLNQAIPS